MEYRAATRSFDVGLAILGFLLERPMHGYDLRSRLQEGLGNLWRIASSQLYSVLHRLAANEWIACRVERPSSRPSRNTYRITDLGEKAFWAWATSPVPHVRDVRVELLAKIYFLRRLAPERISTLVDGEMDALRRLRDTLSRRETIESDDPEFGRVALSFRRHQVEATLSWLEKNRPRLVGQRNEP